MDWIKYPYRAMAQMNEDDDTLTPIQWVIAEPDAPNLEVGSRVCNLVWEVDKEWYVEPVGERWHGGRRATWVKIPPGIDGSHQCGTNDDFEHGGHYDDTEPPPRIGAFGWPLCCDPPRRIAGGAGGGGECSVSVTSAIDVRGGAGAGGECEVTSGPIDATIGGLDLGGHAGDFGFGVDATAGGVELGGSAGDLLHVPDPTYGGIELGGQAGDQRGYLDPTSGGYSFGGQAGDQQGMVDATRGGIELGGRVVPNPPFIDPTAGGMQLGGKAGDIVGGPLLVDTFFLNPGAMNMRPVENGLDTPTNWIAPLGTWTAGSGFVTLGTGKPETIAYAVASQSDVTCYVDRGSSTALLQVSGLCYRVHDLSNYWAFWIERDGIALPYWEVGLWNGTSFTTTMTGSVGDLAAHVLRVVLRGNLHTLYIDLVEVGAFMSSTWQTEKGFGIFGFTASTYNAPALTFFEVDYP